MAYVHAGAGKQSCHSSGRQPRQEAARGGAVLPVLLPKLPVQNLLLQLRTPAVVPQASRQDGCSSRRAAQAAGRAGRVAAQHGRQGGGLGSGIGSVSSRWGGTCNQVRPSGAEGCAKLPAPGAVVDPFRAPLQSAQLAATTALPPSSAAAPPYPPAPPTPSCPTSYPPEAVPRKEHHVGGVDGVLY